MARTLFYERPAFLMPLNYKTTPPINAKVCKIDYIGQISETRSINSIGQAVRPSHMGEISYVDLPFSFSQSMAVMLKQFVL
jgi:hypothetical protein